MADPGYGPNGQRLTASGLIDFEANGPILNLTDGDEVWTIRGLGMAYIPTIRPVDDEAITYNYLGEAL